MFKNSQAYYVNSVFHLTQRLFFALPGDNTTSEISLLSNLIWLFN